MIPLKKILFMLMAIMLWHFGAYAQADTNWRLVWSDEFNYNGRPDPTKWAYELATHRNNEAQIYTNNPENVFVKDGFLNIVGLKKDVANPRYIAGSSDWDKSDPQFHYTSASLTTRNKATWKYGKIVVRAKTPGTKGTWPAIWLLGQDRQNQGWPKQGEIDVMEQFGKFANNITTGTLHYAAKGNFAHVKTGDNLVKLNHPISDEFHVYTAIWDSTHITLLFDDKTVLNYTYPYRDIVFNQQPFYLIINLAMGGIGGGAVDPSTLPAKFIIDYVRVYQKN